MDSIARDILVNNRKELIEAWVRLIESEPKPETGFESRGLQGWMSSLLHLLEKRLADPADSKVHEFIGTLVQKGPLSRLPIGQVVRYFQLFRRAYASVRQGLEVDPSSETTIDLAAQEMILAACRHYDERLSAAEEKFETLFDNADMVILNIEINGRIEKINRRGAKILGYQPEELVGAQLAKLIHPDDLPILTQSIGHVLAGNPHIFVIRALAKDREVRHLDMALTPSIEGGRVNSMRAIARNATKQMELQSKLAVSEEKYRSLIENAGDAILLMALENGRILDANTLARKMTGLARDEICEHNVVDLFDREDERMVIAHLQDTITVGSSMSQDLLLLNTTGPDNVVEISSTVIEFAGSKVIQSLVKDAGSRWRIEKMMADKNQRLLEAEREAADIRNQLEELERPSRSFGLVHQMIERLCLEQQSQQSKGEPLMNVATAALIQAASALMRPTQTTNGASLVEVESLVERYVRLLSFVHRGQVYMSARFQAVSPVFLPADTFETVVAGLLQTAIDVSIGSPEPNVVVAINPRGRMVTIEIQDSAKSLSAFELQNMFDDQYEYFERDTIKLKKARDFLERNGGGLLIQGLQNGGNLTTIFLLAHQADTEAVDYQMVLFGKKAPEEE